MRERKTEIATCPDCGVSRVRKVGWKSLFCRSCAQTGDRSANFKHGISHSREYQRLAMQRLRAKWREQGKHQEMKEKYVRERLRRYERKAGRSCPEVCEVCGGKQQRHRTGWHGGYVTHLCYDHNHITGEFRGWLCSNCNKCLGLVNDDISRLKKLIAYLERKNG